MEQKYDDERRKVVKYLIIILAILTILNLVLIFLSQKENIINNITPSNISFISNENITLIEMNVPAVDEKGNGTSTILVVEATKGTGRTLVDIENLLFWADTQQSIRMGRYVAGNITGKNLNNYDLIYGVKANNASIIGGPSAGAAITIATIFALQGKQPREDVMITGTINHDGSIGPISGVLEKAKAAKLANAKILVVPLSQSTDVVYDTKEYCQEFGNNEICSTETKPRKVNVSEEAGIRVIEAETINEAIKYFER